MALEERKEEIEINTPNEGDDTGGQKADASKGDLLAFVRGAQGNPRYRKTFLEGEWWSDEAEFRQVYIDEGWTDTEGFLNRKGAAIINYADSLHDEDEGFDTVLALLNKTGVETFVRKAVGLHDSGEFEPDEDGGFTGTGSFTGDGNFF